MSISKHTPLFFKKLPVTEDTPPNAVYSKFLQELPKAQAHEIKYCDEMWVVGREDFHTVEDGLAATARNYNNRICTARELHKPKTLAALANCLGWGKSTLRKRMKLVSDYLPKPTSENVASDPLR